MAKPDPDALQRAAAIEAEIVSLREIRARRLEAVANLTRSIDGLERELAELRAPSASPLPAAGGYGDVRHAILDLIGAAEEGLRATEVAAGLARRLGAAVGPRSHYVILKRLLDEGRLSRYGDVYEVTDAGVHELVERRHQQPEIQQRR